MRPTASDLRTVPPEGVEALVWLQRASIFKRRRGGNAVFAMPGSAGCWDRCTLKVRTLLASGKELREPIPYAKLATGVTIRVYYLRCLQLAPFDFRAPAPEFDR